ncbi:MAG: Ig-like domain repeat protein, partial [Candidatus Margulisbacteria bacterium]|nr:Ig-like domain repeat protein [Candidatus Margulisiibacteriota bacterium]
LKDSPETITFSDVSVVKDTVPPDISAKPNLFAFSPNGDGKFDSIDNMVKTNEKGKIYLNALRPGSLGSLFNEEVSAEAHKEYKINWAKDEVKVSEQSGDLLDKKTIASSYSDGNYVVTVYAIDEAGNISENIVNNVVVDTTPPKIISLSADPNPFTPNDDGAKDTTNFNYEFSEPVYVTTNIYREDGGLFYKNETATAEAVSSWTWDGRGLRNELLGGTYSYNVYAEDLVGNSITSDDRTIVVDHVPGLISYAYAEPDPFSSVNNFTEVVYYLARDGLNISVAVTGETIGLVKSLVDKEIQGKGEHRVRWYGDYDSGYIGAKAVKNQYRVGDGSYAFKVTAVDPSEDRPAQVTNSVLVDNAAPGIVVQPVKLDYPNKKVSMTYNLSELATVEVELYDEDAGLISAVSAFESLSPGNYDVLYDFSEHTSVANAYFKIIAKDLAGNITEVETEKFSFVEDELQLTGNYALPSTFTPNGDGLSDLLKIGYSISGGEPDYKVNIDILDPSGATVKNLIENETQTKGSYFFYWEGLNDSAKFSPDGEYEYVITAEDKLVSSIQQRASFLLVSTRPSVNILTSPAVFSPNNDGSKDKIMFNYSINYPDEYISGEALVKIEVLNASNEALWSKIFINTPGTYNYEYNGLDSGGTSLEAGLYYLKISAEDALKTTAIPKTVTFEVDYDAPTVAISSITPDPFSPHVNGEKDQTVISYTLAKPASVTIRIKQAESEIKTLQADKWTEAYIAGSSASGVKAFAIPTITWDGKNEAGEYVEDGNYSVEISALDSAGNSSVTSQMVEVDNLAPMDPILGALPKYSNENYHNIVGTAEAGSRIDVYINSNLIAKGTVESDASFNVPISLTPGVNSIKTRSQDVAGNYSGYSASQTVTYETDAPVMSNFSVSPNPAKAGFVTLTFEASETLAANPVVNINDETATFSRRFPLSAGWGYEYTYEVTTSEKQGLANILIEVTDLSGNTNSLAPSEVEGLIV